MSLSSSDPRVTRLADPALIASLSHFVRSRVPASEVDDIVQSALTEALAAERAPEDADEVAAWVHGIARHKVVDWFRRSRREAPEDPSVTEAVAAVEAAPESARDLLRWAQDELPGRRGRTPGRSAGCSRRRRREARVDRRGRRRACPARAAARSPTAQALPRTLGGPACRAHGASGHCRPLGLRPPEEEGADRATSVPVDGPECAARAPDASAHFGPRSSRRLHARTIACTFSPARRGPTKASPEAHGRSARRQTPALLRLERLPAATGDEQVAASSGEATAPRALLAMRR